MRTSAHSLNILTSCRGFMQAASEIPEICEKNNLLSSLHENDLAMLRPHFKVLNLSYGQVLYEPGDSVQYAYLPCGNTLISFVVPLADARGVETAMVGREGAVGGIVSQGRLPAYCRSVVQYPGLAIRIESVELEKAKNASISLRHFFARYADCLLAQIFQAVACNATHTIEQRTAKWLLAAVDRTGAHEVPLTQEQLAGMLGVGRSYVSRVMAGLKSQGIIEIRRGRLVIHKLEQLKKHACQCNVLTQNHFHEVLAGVYPMDEEVRAAK